ncbi:putative zinc metalloprotease [Scheffersomyces coipomensis]|uniref:putative zinc metalloprotease n=1 Tax=Scheffersomyces coipomensis TaxID=1788519 RepID=UPI00315D543D
MVPGSKLPCKSDTPNIFIRFIRTVFGYRKTTLTLFVVLSLVFTFLFSWYDNNLDYSVALPTDPKEKLVLDEAWFDLQKIAKYEHTYGSTSNDYVHDYLQSQILSAIKGKAYIEYDNDLNGTNSILFSTRSSPEYSSVSYYESNNLIVRINGSDSTLPALLLSAHYDAVPSSFGVTDDGMGIASLLGVLYHYSENTTAQPKRTIIFNFNNNEEFGLYGATSFLSHPWFEQIKYFLNLEGTGAGGKAILFRATDYGIVKFFKDVRYPYGTSIFQEGFNNHLIHSETDYKVYKEKGSIRGLDLAFYKPRDIYHTGGDNIKNINIKALWHMLANSLDFTDIVSSQQIDLDDEYLKHETANYSHDVAAYSSFLNYFFAFPVSQVFIVNVATLLIVPIIEIPFLLIIFSYKKVWKVSFLNVIKFPLSVVLSLVALHEVVRKTVEYNEFLPNSGAGLLVVTYSAIFLLSNYIVLNLFNALNGYKVINHDEKLIVLFEISILYKIILIWSTIKLADNKIGDDHSGEFPFLFLYLLQAVASIFGFIGWSLKSSKKPTIVEVSEESQPLLSDQGVSYGSEEGEPRFSGSSSLSFDEEDLFAGHEKLKKFFSYDWSIQFLIVVPLSSLLIYNSGFLIIDGIHKSIQESLASEFLIYKFILVFSVAWSLPFLPFVFKLNRIIVLGLLTIVASGVFLAAITEPFDQLNPLKVRFIQTVDLNLSGSDSFVNVYGRVGTPLSDVLSDVPSLKESNDSVNCTALTDGNQVCSYKSSLPPHFVEGISDFNDYLQIDVLKNSSSGTDHPFGFLVGEFKIKAPKNRMCVLNFKNAITSNSEGSNYKDVPVKTVIVYDDKTKSNLSNVLPQELNIEAIPEGYSRDEKGNYIFKDLNGINELQLNKLSWTKDYHVAVQWVPNLVEDATSNKLAVSINCFWADLAPLATEDGVIAAIPAYDELLHYSPNYVSWANRDRGLVSISKSIEI